ncbi:mechanosensitive ion channel family protein [Portibacter lacus]|uniref:Mechanosensitive ion channel protein n=1 Tax=Portibacter lacus TaxID=1099794 RepID=A0AA37WFP2_9BACT|nr:mechanosensitive ion channel family protein [Portibacter lacus]GLR17055.1 mechanosensitive ion channel protein [Portibacter lacus]
MEEFSKKLAESYKLLIEKLGGWFDAIILNIPNIIIAVLVAFLAYFLSKYVRKLTVKTTKKFTTNKTIVNLVSNLTSVIFTVIVLFIILSIFNLSGTINKILATAGVLGLAVGLALQDPMNNLFSGVFMSVRKLYAIGDIIESNDHFGTIKDIDLRATKIRTPDGHDVVIPNKDVIQNPLENYTSSGERRIDLDCGVSYGDDLDKVEELTLKAISSLDNLMEHKPVEVMFTEFGDSSINFTVRYWIEATTQKEYTLAKSNGIKAIKKIFDANDIMIPFPIRTLDFGIKGGVPMSKMLSMKKNQEMKENNILETSKNN